MSGLRIIKPVTHVIFSLDGVLIDTEMIHKNTFMRIAAEYGKQYPDDLRDKILGRQAIDVATIFINTLKIDLTPQQFMDKVEDMESEQLANVQLMYGVEELLKHLQRHKIPMAVATSSSKSGFHMKTSHLQDYFSVFQHVVTGASDPAVKHGKPAPDIFNVCVSRFPDYSFETQCLVFEHSLNGVTAALAAGMQVVMVPDFFSMERPTDIHAWDKATLVLDSLEEFSPEIFSLPPYFEI